MEQKVQYISSNIVIVDFPKSELNTEEDVLEYIEAFKKALLDEIKNNKRISLWG